MANRKAAQKAILTAVDSQLRGNDIPEVKETYDRLRSQGHSDKDARNLIGAALAIETFRIIRHGEEYNVSRYVANLRKLPVIPDD